MVFSEIRLAVLQVVCNHCHYWAINSHFKAKLGSTVITEKALSKRFLKRNRSAIEALAI
jgi:hypothetical protein